MSSSIPKNLDHVVLDGSQGEGGGQILRTALTLSLLTGRAFRMVKIRANRDKPGLRPQHHKAVQAAVQVGQASVAGGGVGARELLFLPKPYEPRNLSIDIGTAGSTGLVLQTLHLPLALRAELSTRLVLTGGTHNPKAPAFSFLDITWCAYLAAFGMPLTLSMSAAGFYPRGGGRLEASIEPATPRPFVQTDRGPLRRLHGVASVANLDDDIARRMRDHAVERLREHGLDAEIELRGGSSVQGRGPRFRSRPSTNRSCLQPSSVWASGVSGLKLSRTKPSPSFWRSRPSRRPPSIPTPPIRSSCPWRSRPVAVNSLSAKSPSTSAPTPKPSAPFSTGPSRSKSRRSMENRGALYWNEWLRLTGLDRETSTLTLQIAQIRQALLDLSVFVLGIGEFRRSGGCRIGRCRGEGRLKNRSAGGHRRYLFKQFGQDAAVHVVGNRNAEQVEHGWGHIEEHCLLRFGTGAKRSP